MDKIKRLKELTEQLNQYRDSYYNNSESLISDKQYDNLFDELQKLEEETGIVMSNSPTYTVGYEVKSKLEKVKHSHLMLSLGKTKSTDDLIKFSDNKDCILSLKLDGLTVLNTYNNGVLYQSETRGNGEEGEIITHNAKVFDNLPLNIPCDNKFEIEGEAIITQSDFEKINANGEYKNCRNLVSGSVRQLDSNITKDRHVRFVAWKIPFGVTTYSIGFEMAAKWGFEIVPYVKYNSLTDNIEEKIEELKIVAKEKSFPIDGLVITYDNIEYGKSLGTTGHHPKHSLAYKFYDEEVTTTLKDIVWTMSKTGVLTPVAIFTPVEIEGSVVEKASLHNISIMESLYPSQWYEGLMLDVYKANMVIPQVKRVYDPQCICNCRLFIPDACPVCGKKTEIVKENNSKVLICVNPDCKGKLLGKLVQFCSKNAINIEGMSEATLQFLINKGWIKTFKDIYTLDWHWDEWIKCDGFGEKSVLKLLENIKKSKNTTLHRFIYSLSIPQIGHSASKDIAKFFNNDYENFRKYGIVTHYTQIDGFGESMNNSLHQWLNANHLMMELLAQEFTFKKEENNSSEIDLSEKIFVITGSLTHYKNRNELTGIIEQLGGKVSGSISSKTSYLINNDTESSSSKNKKAKELGIPIINEEDFIKMIS